MGLVVPADFDDVLASGQTPRLEGYVVWSNRIAARELKAGLEQQVGGLLGQPVRINVEGNVVYPRPDSRGALDMFVGTVVILLVVVGLFVVSHLMFEEKQTRTMDVLLVSPASIAQVVAGKALAGGFYCLVAVGAALAFRWTAVTHWGVAVLAVLVGALFSVAAGLLFGVLFESSQQMGLWVGVPVILLLAAMMVEMLGAELPAGLVTIIAWLPTTAMAEVLQISFSGGGTLAKALPDAGVALGWSLLLYSIVVWKVRRSSR
jgi:ABC-2 type transport system permease protein